MHAEDESGKVKVNSLLEIPAEDKLNELKVNLHA